MNPRDTILDAGKTAWETTVGAALRMSEKEIGLFDGALKRKVQAIRLLVFEGGHTFDSVRDMGQTEALALYARIKKPAGKERVVRWRIDAMLADAIQSKRGSADQEESLQQRLIRVCNIRYSNDLWEFILSCFADLSDRELRNLAGDVRKKRQ